jgi:hypothetical protein
MGGGERRVVKERRAPVRRPTRFEAEAGEAGEGRGSGDTWREEDHEKGGPGQPADGARPAVA